MLSSHLLSQGKQLLLIESKRGIVLRGKKYSPVKYGVLFLFVCIASATCFVGNTYSAATLVAKTYMTVVNVGQWYPDSPSQVVNYKVTHDLYYVSYHGDDLTFYWEPLPGYSPWPYGSAPPITARIWALRTSDLGKTYAANAWDYLYNNMYHRHINPNKSYNGVGTMVSSLCHTNSTCNATERTNIMFFP